MCEIGRKSDFFDIIKGVSFKFRSQEFRTHFNFVLMHQANSLSYSKCLEMYNEWLKECSTFFDFHASQEITNTFVDTAYISFSKKYETPFEMSSGYGKLLIQHDEEF
jgi:hypothetical protein